MKNFIILNIWLQQRLFSSSFNRSSYLRHLLFLLINNDFSGTSDLTSSSGSNKTDLSTWRNSSWNSRRMTNMLMVTTTVGMFNGVRGNTSDMRPAVSLNSIFVISSASFQHRFVLSSTTSDDTDHSSVGRFVQFFHTRWKFDSGLASIWVVSNDGNISTRSFGNLTSVTTFFFQRTGNNTFRHGTNWQTVTNSKLSLLTAVDKLTSADTFGANDGFSSLSVFVWIVDDVLDETLDETVFFSIIEGSHFGGTLTFTG